MVLYIVSLIEEFADIHWVTERLRSWKWWKSVKLIKIRGIKEAWGPEI